MSSDTMPEPIDRLDDDPTPAPAPQVEGMPEAEPVPEFDRAEYEDAASMRDAIFAVDDIPTELVAVPEWGVDVLCKGMSGNESVAIMEGATGDKDQGRSSVDFAQMYPDIVILTAYHPGTGERLFQRSDRKALMAKSGSALNRVAMAGMRLSGLTQEATNEAGKGS